MQRGRLCISIDVEMAWGIWDKPNPAYFDACAAHELEIVRGLVDAFDAHDAPATWAIVGRLLDRDAAAAGGSRHGDRIWYAPASIEAIRGARVRHDIGSHSYAHRYFGEAPREELRADLAHAREVHDRHGLPFTSFVFPRNQVGHLDLLADAGVRVYRSTDHGWHVALRERLGRVAGRVANFVDKALPVPPATVRPIPRGRLVELPSSMLLLARNGLRALIPPAALVAKARAGLRAAARTGDVFHLWFHPSNFYWDTARQLATLRAILGEAAAMRARGELDIAPMSAFAS